MNNKNQRKKKYLFDMKRIEEKMDKLNKMRK